MNITEVRKQATWALAGLALLFIFLFLMAETQRGQQEAAVKRLSYQLTVTLSQQFAEICGRKSGDASRLCREDAKERAGKFVADIAAPY